MYVVMSAEKWNRMWRKGDAALGRAEVRYVQFSSGGLRLVSGWRRGRLDEVYYYLLGLLAASISLRVVSNILYV